MGFSELSRAWRGPDNSTPVGGILLCHGFTGSPQSMRPWGEHLAEAGWDVRIPVLPGHATSWQDLNRVRWQDWTAHLTEAAEELIARHGRIVIGGMSMGGALALALAVEPRLRPGVAALMLVNPIARLPLSTSLALPVVARLRQSVGPIGADIRRPGVHEEAYPRTPVAATEQLRQLLRHVRGELGSVRVPMLLATSPEDHTVAPVNSEIIAAGIRGPVQRLTLRDSYHVATLDHDAELLFTVSDRFARGTISPPSPPSGQSGTGEMR
ncbi:MAG: alpha/beta fold hydrolase [Brachybacterium sp.]|nr:alpha/beta fold hydrolase [Brachybacterium sp.]